jgi:C4-dicarboxylate-specific signal transduction histidine kinase
VTVTDESDGLAIIISDNGPGVKEGTEESIFEPYFSTKPDGIGLGLAIVGEIMADYDGELSLVKDNQYEGATFKLLFRKRV